ncbi:Glycosyltransferase involved in cell wall bisynthesis [Alkalibacterium subtropicum]|uniref:Glycosyltransferase involved in cell wall bisynthesis n=1 Tax=Alkalibacterium subtropicum TaxID=753702 RepID=A0A1I1GEE1_9LACT|nr:glycosyltransferase [Alkalibacterium subtropicum]SFC09836.1 Glycosyltransferase involved in cell wall bisynthesis [Alkalibacterium subtropicum]
MKNIGVFVDRWLSGGIESYLVSNFENMNLKNVTITILTTRKFSDLYDDRLQRMGIEIKELLPEGRDSELTRTFKSLRAFKEVLKNERYDVLHLNIYNGVSLVYSKIARECGVERVIAHSHNSAMGQVRLRTLKIISHKLGKLRYEKFVSDYWACSDLAGAWLFSEKHKDKVILMKNGIDTTKFRYDKEKRRAFREKYDLSENEWVLGNMGRLNNQKNQLFLLDIARELRKKGVSFTLLIAGEGELRNSIEAKITEYGLAKNVHLIGTVNDASSFYSAIDIFLLPSLFEGNPIVGIEAQCSGVKCLLADTITRQAKVIDTTVFLSLESPAAWVKVIDESRTVDQNRRFFDRIVKKNHYDISDTSRNLEMNLTN